MAVAAKLTERCLEETGSDYENRITPSLPRTPAAGRPVSSWWGTRMISGRTDRWALTRLAR